MKLKLLAGLTLLTLVACNGKQDASTDQSSEPLDTTLVEAPKESKVPDDFYFVEYVNPRFAFRCEYPSFLDKGEAPANGDGRVFSNKELVITVYGSYDELGNDDINDAFAAAKSKTDTLQMQKDNWYLLAGNNNGNVYHRKTLVVDGAFVTALVTYPAHLSKVYAPIVDKVLTSLEAVKPIKQ